MKKVWKRLIAVLLVSVILCGNAPIGSVIAFAQDIIEQHISTNNTKKIVEQIDDDMTELTEELSLEEDEVSVCAASDDYMDFDVFYARALNGLEPSSMRAKMHFDYYMSDDVFSPCENFLNSCRNDTGISAGLAAWEADPSNISSAVKRNMNKSDYCEAIILQALDITYSDTAITSIIKNKAIKYSQDFASKLCSINKVSTIAELTDKVGTSWNDTEYLESYEKIFKEFRFLGKTSKYVEGVGTVLSYSKDIIAFIDNFAMYSAMMEIDAYQQQWLKDMRDNCPADNIPMQLALSNLIMASSGTVGAILNEIRDAGQTLATWTVKVCVDAGIGVLTSANPVVAAIFAGLKAGRLLSNIFFSTDDEYEQFYVLEQVVALEKMARKCVKDAGTSFVGEQTEEKGFIFSKYVELYFGTITKVDSECMKEFLDTLYNKGLLKGLLKAMFGAEGDYESHIAALDSLIEARKNNLTTIDAWVVDDYFNQYPSSYDIIFGDNTEDLLIPMDSISLFRPDRVSGATADVEVGSFITLNYYYTPNNANLLDYTVTSSNPAIVKADGLRITGVSIGTTSVTITSAYDSSVTSTISIVVGEEGSISALTQDTHFKYKVLDEGKKTAAITGVENTSVSVLRFPTYIDGYKIVEISENAFKDNAGIRVIHLSSTLIRIGKYAFARCIGLSKLVVPDSVTEIDSFAFLGCDGLKTISTGNGVVSLNGFYFPKDTLVSIIVGNSIKRIEQKAFLDCSLLSFVQLGDGITSIGNCAFQNCSSLSTITFSDRIMSIESSAFRNCTSLTSFELPNSVTSIGSYSFYGCSNLRTMTAGKALSIIGEKAFYNCSNLSQLILKNGLSKIEKNAFDGCESIKTVNFQGSLVEWCMIDFESSPLFYGADNALSINGVSIESLIIPEEVESIPSFAFSKCSTISSISFGSKTTCIGAYAFYKCNGLTELRIPDRITDIGKGAFSYCEKLEYINTGNGVNSLNGFDFKHSPVKEIIIGDSVTELGAYPFRDCRDLENVSLGNNITRIPTAAFMDCKNLTSIQIPKSVKEIGYHAFYGCYSISAVSFGGSASDWCKIVYSGSYPLEYAKNNAMRICNQIVTDVVLSNEVTSIPPYAFKGCSELSTISIPLSVTDIGAKAFANCVSLTDVYYEGNESDKQNITISANGNGDLTNATWHYCSSESGESHVHFFGNEWKMNELSHWNLCVCGEKGNLATHDFDSGRIISQPTTDRNGMRIYTCTVCGYQKNETIPALTNPYDLPENDIIKGNAANNKKTYAYRSTITFTAEVLDGSSVQWYIDGQPAGNGLSMTVEDKKSSYTIIVVVTAPDGTQTMDEEHVTIQSSFFAKVVWFFLHILVPGKFRIEQ